MRLIHLLAAAGLVAARPSLHLREPEDASTLMQDLNDEALKLLKDREGAAIAERSGTCTVENSIERKDWAVLSSKERKDYIDAVLCLQKLPSKSDPNWAPGAKTRYDDFLAIHIDLTPKIHRTGNFLT
jgi:tyrosinase